MDTKTIKISEETYRWLIQLSGEMQKDLGRPVSIDRALRKLRSGKVSDLAGSWEMSDEEVHKMFKKLSGGWRKWKISV